MNFAVDLFKLHRRRPVTRPRRQSDGVVCVKSVKIQKGATVKSGKGRPAAAVLPRPRYRFVHRKLPKEVGEFVGLEMQLDFLKQKVKALRKKTEDRIGYKPRERKHVYEELCRTHLQLGELSLPFRVSAMEYYPIGEMKARRVSVQIGSEAGVPYYKMDFNVDKKTFDKLIASNKKPGTR